MAYLGKFRKVILMKVAEELGESVTPADTVVSIKNKILNSTEYEDAFVKEPFRNRLRLSRLLRNSRTK